MGLIASLSRHPNKGFDRLQALILALRAGDAVQTADLARASGLSERWCRRSLEALANVGVMSQEQDGRFVRRRLAGLAS
jgi:predicted transcriptional regulator